MAQLDKILKNLKRRGFTLVHSTGSKCKLYPPLEMRDKPYYSLHVGEQAIHPLKRFFKKNYQMDLLNLD